MEFYATISPEKLPLVTNRQRTERYLAQWQELGRGNEDLARFARAVAAADPGHALLAAIFGHSPFLTSALLNDPAFARILFEQGPGPGLDTVLADIEAGHDDIASLLRRAKRRAALAIAVADITGTWSVDELTRHLSHFADACLATAVDQVLREAAAKGALTLKHEDDPARDCGFVVLAMGKLGAFELNYSSDIDLVLLYDPEKVATDRPDEMQQTFTRLARSFVKLMEERTQDGYVFRTDLRLRPDPGSTPLALSSIAAETYYESQGQNWERAAMIKARPAAGDLKVGAAFLDHLKPFIWRKHLDFAAIADIQSIKRQIEAQRGGTDIAIEGHNIKLGRGGIREIEFFVQTQQLIWGGRERQVRARGTLDSLTALTELGRVAPDTADEIAAAYRFLRTLEHRLQMVDDQQTQTLPGERPAIAQLAAFMGLAEDRFRDTLTHHLQTVAGHYGDL
ncbi:MAG: glutamine-synthetase adenylyltransferase, partial [Alphaproteobacteria bacterium]|nr:glutamine-synthetase adenylyltransferase [Alphaproteobacteria bacterium]